MTHSENSTDVALINQVLLVNQKQRTLFYKYVGQSLTAKINVSNRMIDQLTTNQEVVKRKLTESSALNATLTKEKNDLSSLQSSLQAESVGLNATSDSLQVQLQDFKKEEERLNQLIRDEEKKRQNAAMDWIPLVGFFAGLFTGDYERMIPGYSTISGIISRASKDKEALQDRLNQKNNEYQNNWRELNRVKTSYRAVGVKISTTNKKIEMNNRRISECESTTKRLGEKHTIVLNEILVLKNLVTRIEYSVKMELQNLVEFDLHDELVNMFPALRQVIGPEMSHIVGFIGSPYDIGTFETRLLAISNDSKYNVVPETDIIAIESISDSIQLIPVGKMTIYSVSSASYISSNAEAGNAPLVKSTFTNRTVQWNIELIKDDIYCIQNMETLKWLDGRHAAGCDVYASILPACDPEKNHYYQWRIIKLKDGNFAFKSVSSKCWLDGRADCNTQIPVVKNGEVNPEGDQYLKWDLQLLVPIGIVNIYHASKKITLAAKSGSPGNVISLQEAANDSKSCQWNIQPIKDDLYSIENMGSKCWLDGREVAGETVLVSASNRNPLTDKYLQWKILKVSRSGYCLKSVSSNCMVECDDSKNIKMVTFPDLILLIGFPPTSIQWEITNK
ncbi:hypothetical protein BC833DRAFT_603620 [Globomyces pollinis-pini]|nr:hypothetical protein BC833DRAFT_603620 [Globomyces pollinis-pini]